MGLDRIAGIAMAVLGNAASEHSCAPTVRAGAAYTYASTVTKRGIRAVGL